MSCGMVAMPPRRATVSAIRRPEIAVMFATAIGSVVPTPSGVVRSTSNREVTLERAGRHENVVVGQIRGWAEVIEESHVTRGYRLLV